MSQTWNLPVVLATDLANAAIQKCSDGLVTLDSMFSGATAPTHSLGRLWLDTSGAPTYAIWISDGTNWRKLFDNVFLAAGGGGLVLKSAGAFDTAAPTSAVAATTATQLTRKGEMDAREKHLCLPLGDITAPKNFFLLGNCGAVTVVDIVIISETATSSDASNKWGINVVNVTDTKDLRTADYDTDSDGDFAANTPLNIALNQNLAVDANKLLRLEFVETGTADTLTNAVAILRYKVAA